MMVLSEMATLTEACHGTSISRFGHGELAILNGKDAAWQKYDPLLAEELRAILRSSRTLVSVPHTRGKRAWEWKAFLSAYGCEIKQDRWYGSAFISRRDEVDWPDGYVELASSLFERGSFLKGVGIDDYERVDELERTALSMMKMPVLLSCGPTATVLAERLAKKGLWAIDIGNMRNFL